MSTQIFFILALHGVTITFLELGTEKQFHGKVSMARYFMVICLFKYCVLFQQFHIPTE